MIKTNQTKQTAMAPTRASQLARTVGSSTSGTSTKPGKRCKACDRTKSGQCSRHRRMEQEEVLGVEDTLLAEARKRSRESSRAYLAEGKKYGYKRKPASHPCKGPDGKTGTCGKPRGVAFSGKGVNFCSPCFLSAYGVEAHKAAKAARQQREYAALNVGGPGRSKAKCMGRGKDKVCPNLIAHKSGILGALKKTGMKDGPCRTLRHLVHCPRP